MQYLGLTGLSRFPHKYLADRSPAVPCGIGEHDHPVSIVVDAVEIDSFASFDVVVATFVIGKERRPLSLVAPLGIGRCEREALRQSDPGARTLVKVDEPSGYVADAGRRIVVDAASDM